MNTPLNITEPPVNLRTMKPFGIVYADALGRFGSFVDTAEFTAHPRTLPPWALGDPDPAPALPGSALLDNLPSIAMQGTSAHLGSPGSCEAQSFARGLGSYTAARTPEGIQKWAPSLPENEVSAAFMYAWAHSVEDRPCPSGSLATPYLTQLICSGSPSAAQVPYRPDCTYLSGIDVTKQFPQMDRFRIGSFTTFQISSDTMPLLKKLLATGQAVAFSGLVLSGYPNPVLTNGVICGQSTIPGSGHGQLLIGYDDSLATTGAFLVQNSFGRGWPAALPGGRAWISYEAFLAAQKLAAVAYPVSSHPPHGIGLSSSTAPAPTAIVVRSYQWSPDDNNVYLILRHYFGAPVKLHSVALTEPDGGQTATANYSAYLSEGYTYLRRADGKQFLPGRYAVTRKATTLDKQSVQYTGTVEIADAWPKAPSAAPMAAPIYGTTELVAVLT